MHSLQTHDKYVLFSILRKTLRGFARVPGAGMTEAEMLVYLPKVRGLH